MSGLEHFLSCPSGSCQSFRPAQLEILDEFRSTNLRAALALGTAAVRHFWAGSAARECERRPAKLNRPVSAGVKIPLLFILLLVLPSRAMAASDAELRASGEPARQAVQVDYQRDVRPILANRCYQCHGPDEAQRQADLRLDQSDAARAELPSGSRAIVPGKPDRSELLLRVLSDDHDLRMPPEDTGERLAEKEIALLREWIAAGAPWSSHWSFVRPRTPDLPAVQDSQWAINAIDRFVLAQMEPRNLRPAPRADRRTLIRRLTLSLTGLPPTSDEIRGFLQDDRPGAYTRLVERLLQSPRYGEHAARYWLDAARYGDTHGLHLDNERSIWRYRDWVIQAFNRNLPFDQFTIEQLAGDLLPAATLDQKIATGFHRCNVTTGEGGAIPEEFLARYAVDRVETTATVWMGLTAGCAACHDHKFDPISQREFYQLYAYFYNLTEKAMDGNALLPPPSIKAPTYTQRIRQRDLQSQLSDLDRQLRRREQLARDDRGWEPDLARLRDGGAPPKGAVVRLAMDRVDQDATTAHGQLLSVPGKVQQALAFDGKSHLSVSKGADFERTDAFSLGGWINVSHDHSQAVLSKMSDGDAFRGYDLYVGGGKLFVHLVHSWEANAIRVHTTLPIRKEKWHHVMVTYDGSSRAQGVHVYLDGRQQSLEITHDKLTGTIRNDEPLRVGRRSESAPFHGMIDDVHVFDRVLTDDEVLRLMQHDPVGMALGLPKASRTSDQDGQVVETYLRTIDPQAMTLFQTQRELASKLAQLESRFPSTLVMKERSERRVAYVLKRGQYDEPLEAVKPGVPEVFPQPKAKTASRLSLAEWLVDPEHPLTARVIVNRLWQQHFGYGLVRTTEDFGIQGELPSHPDLLDYLACELIRTGWDVKAIHRMIVLSATFQQSSVHGDHVAIDPDNRWLSRGPRFRLDAEVVRDLVLSVSGLLVRPLGGPSVKPYQPEGLWEAVGYPTSTTARFRQDSGAKLYRRSLYTFWKRTSPPPAMQILDAPTREVCQVRRSRTNTPAAALLLMNDVQFIEAARKFAERLLRLEDLNDEERLDWAYTWALGRPSKSRERTVLLGQLRANRVDYQAMPEWASSLVAHGEAPVDRRLNVVELAAWTMVCSTILNLDETISQH